MLLFTAFKLRGHVKWLKHSQNSTSIIVRVLALPVAVVMKINHSTLLLMDVEPSCETLCVAMWRKICHTSPRNNFFRVLIVQMSSNDQR